MHIVAIYRNGKTLVSARQFDNGDEARAFAQDFNADRSNSFDVCAHTYSRAAWDYDRATDAAARLAKRKAAAQRKRAAAEVAALFAA